MLRRLNKKAQTTAEYAILIAIVVGALVGMQVYVRRGLQGRIRDAMDSQATLTPPSDPTITGLNITFTGNQFEPYYTAIGNVTRAYGGGTSRSGDTESGTTYGQQDFSTTATGLRESEYGLTDRPEGR